MNIEYSIFTYHWKAFMRSSYIYITPYLMYKKILRKEVIFMTEREYAQQ